MNIVTKATPTLTKRLQITGMLDKPMAERKKAGLASCRPAFLTTSSDQNS